MGRVLGSIFAWTFFRFLPEYGVYLAILISFLVGVFAAMEFVAWAGA